MKILNVCETTLYLDDINVAVLYSRDGTPQDIEDAVARKSRNLKWAIKQGMLLDVTKGAPNPLPERRQFLSESAKESPHARRESVLVRDDHFPHADDAPKSSPKPEGLPSAMDLYREGKMSVVWTGPCGDAGGYARMNRRFMFGLQDKGVQVKYDLLPSMDDMDPHTNERLKKLGQVRVPKDAPKIYGMTAPLHYDWARYKMLFTMMETRRLHKDYVIRCNCADEIIVPSFWCKGVFEESGVNKPIHVVPLGVDTSIYRPDVEPIAFSKNLRPFVFLSVFGWSLRKGYDVLLKAYLEEFTSDDPVSLLISSRYFGSTDECKKQVIRDDVARVSSMVANPKKPHLVLFSDVLSDAMMPRLYAAADCYVSPTRGEGFCLPACEAGACNLPVIFTRYSGQTDFLDDDNAYLIDVDGFECAEKSLAWISYFYEDAEFPILGRPAVEQTRAHMRRVFENRDEAAAKAQRLHEKIKKEYDWSVCVDSMYEKLRSTFEALRLKED